MKRLFFIAFIIFGSINYISAETSFSLDSCRSMAINNNKSLKIATEKVKMSGYEKKSAFANYFPNLDFTAGYVHSSKEISLLNEDQKNMLPNIGTQFSSPISQYLQQLALVDPMLAAKLSPLFQGIGNALNAGGSSLVDALRTDTRNIWGGTITLTQPIFMGGKIIAYNRITHYAEEIAEKQKDSSVKNIVFGVDETYWQIVSLSQKKKLAEEYLMLLDTLQYNINAMIEEGVATRSDGLTVAVKQNEAEITLTKVNDGLSLSKMLLAQMCGIPIDSNFSLEDENKAFMGNNNNSVGKYNMEDVFAHREEIQSLDLATKIYENKRRIELSNMLPNIALIGSYSFSNPNLFNGFEKKVDGLFNVGVVMRVPIFHTNDFFKIKAARSQKNIAQFTLEEAKEKIELQVNQAVFRVNEARKKLEMTTKNMEKAEENLQNASVGFTEGILTTTNVLEAQTAWLQAKSELLDSQIDVHLCDIYLTKALGTMSY
ncbi:MAG: TolC family protein [Bacteroidales bacterium]